MSYWIKMMSGVNKNIIDNYKQIIKEKANLSIAKKIVMLLSLLKFI